MKVRRSSPGVCPTCGHNFASPQLRMSELRRIGAARVRALDKVQLLAELKAAREFLDDMRARIRKLEKEERALLHRLQRVEA